MALKSRGYCLSTDSRRSGSWGSVLLMAILESVQKRSVVPMVGGTPHSSLYTLQAENINDWASMIEI